MHQKTVRIAELWDDAPLNDRNHSDAYAPDPRASQRVAAQQRARTGRPTHDTEPIQPLASTPDMRRYVPFGIGALLLILLMIGAASYQLGRLPSAQPLAVTPGPSTAAFLAAPTASPQAAPVPSTAPTATPRTIGAYAAPDGLLLGQIEADRAIVPVAHSGSAWVAYEDGKGLVWVRTSDRPDLALTGPDLSPVAAQPPQTGHGLTPHSADDTWTPPEATPVPPLDPTATPAPGWPTSAPAAPADFDKPDIRGTCQFIDCLGQNAVDLARAQACHALFWQYGNADPETIPEPDLSAVRGCIWEGLYR